MIFRIIFGENKRVVSPKISVQMHYRIFEGGFAENKHVVSPKISVQMAVGFQKSFRRRQKTFRTENDEQGD